MSEIIAGIRVPDSAIARAATQLARDTEDDLLYNQPQPPRLLWGALNDERRGLKYGPNFCILAPCFTTWG
nr:hypothetical protein [Bradyrhizobium elkanii]